MIYSPREDSIVLAEEVKKQAHGEVLDLGTGSGIQARSAAEQKQVHTVIASDISLDAVKYVKDFITRKGRDKKFLKKIKVVRSDLFENIPKQKFDCIIFNPPYLPEDQQEGEDSKLHTTGGKEGYEIIERFFSNVKKFLKEKGYILLAFSSLTHKEDVDRIIKEGGFQHRELRMHLLFFERLYVYKVWV